MGDFQQLRLVYCGHCGFAGMSARSDDVFRPGVSENSQKSIISISKIDNFDPRLPFNAR